MYSLNKKAAENDLNNVKDDIKDASENVKKDAKSALDNVEDAACDFANDAGRKVRKFFNYANSNIGEYTKEVEDSIRKSPVKASIVALGAGLVLGSVLKGSKSKSSK